LLRGFHSSIMGKIILPKKLSFELKRYIGGIRGRYAETRTERVVRDIEFMFKKRAALIARGYRRGARERGLENAEMIEKESIVDESFVSVDDMAPEKKPNKVLGRPKKRLYAKPSMNPNNPGGRKGRRPKRH
jgi:hypothetical protein